ncbi:MAG: leucine--tRNA ligase [Bacteroidetes bacterium]|nr:leucine--tRNA ligase [Bacteroidota bacterium]
MGDYNFTEIEKKWIDLWESKSLYKVYENFDKPKYYVLDMFPYPSGAGLHVGHPLGYIASDIIARYKRLKGFNVLHPMGFDAFGLPAEQYAIETGKHPADTTNQNIERYKEQLKNIGFSYDWSREIKTCDPNYYKWTQWIFLKLYNSWFNEELNKAEPIETLIYKLENGLPNSFEKAWNTLAENEKQSELTKYRLAYKSESYINWCQALGTVLANDEVVNGLSERGGHPVERKLMSQWFLRITKYADRLLQGLETVDYAESLKEMQRNWIGKSQGAEIDFQLENNSNTIRVFTTRPDTIFGVTFMVIAPEHVLADKIATVEKKKEVEDYINYCKTRSELERKAETKEITGVFTGSFAIHPFTNEKIPIYIAEYVLTGYGTGAIMAVPCGDSRDHAFAKKFGIVIHNIFEGVDVTNEAYEEKSGKITNSEINGFSINGLNIADAKQKVISEIMKKGIGCSKVNYRMRDAGFSRQRYWGEPFPIFYKNDIEYTESVEKLPVTLPDVKSYKPAGDGKSPLSAINKWVNIDGGYIRETDTMPGYAGSSWYYLRYMDPKNDNEFCSKQKSEYWNQVDLYVGGAEHAVGHLLYSRMWCKVLFDLGFINFDEPFKKLVNQGMIGGVVFYFYYNPENKKAYSFYSQVDKNQLLKFKVPNEYISDNETFEDENIIAFCEEFSQFKNYEFVRHEGIFTFEKAITKMSKRLRNVVNPDEIIAKYGADTFRMYEMFLGPLDQDKPWSTKGIDGVSRFLKRFWAYCVSTSGELMFNNEPANEESLKTINRTIKKISDDIEKLSLNTCISTYMICFNELQTQNCRNIEVFKKFFIILSPIAPFIAEELWQKAGNIDSIFNSKFPDFDEKYLTDNFFNYPVSINGKTRTVIKFNIDELQSEIEKAVYNDEIVKKWIDGKNIKKFIFVKGRIINLVID